MAVVSTISLARALTRTPEAIAKLKNGKHQTFVSRCYCAIVPNLAASTDWKETKGLSPRSTYNSCFGESSLGEMLLNFQKLARYVLMVKRFLKRMSTCNSRNGRKNMDLYIA